MYRFEKLKVWHDSVRLVELIYEFVKLFPKDERFSLVDQLKRSSTSIVLNIAEGCGSLGDTEFRSFLRISLKSLYETVAGVKIAEKLFHVDGSKVLNQLDLVGKELNGLIKSLKTSS